MNNYRTISISFWNDSKVDDDFTPEDKYFYLYLLTNPHTNICGCYEISMKQMERETGYNADTCLRLLDRMEKVHKVIHYSALTKEVLLIHWGKYNWTRSDKVIKAVNSVAKYIKNEKFKSYIINKINNIYNTETDTETDVSIGYEYPIDTVSVPYAYPIKEETPKESKKKFIPPTAEEVQAYCKEHNKPIDVEAFISYYGSQGWKKANGQKLSSWELAVSQWYRRDCESGKAKKPETSYDLGQIEQQSMDLYKDL